MVDHNRTETPRVEATSTENQSTMGLVREAMTHVSGLVRGEVDLARAEISENLNKALGGLIALAMALVFAIVALNTFSAALVGWVANVLGLSVGWASLIVAVIFAFIAFAFMSKGRNNLKARSLAPTRTMKNVERDAQTVKEATK